MNLISLVICTRNRSNGLAKCLESLARMAVTEPWEIIVVDNGSTDDTANTIRRFAAATQLPIRYVFEPLVGVARARNHGVAEARGNLIVFTDDDCYPASDFIAQVHRIFADPGVAYFGGRVLLHDPADYPITIQTSTTQQVIAAKSFVVPGVIHGANMGFRREIFSAVGPFNELLGAGTSLQSGEDVEFIARVSAAGFVGGYFPQATVSHHHRRKAEDAKKLQRGYDIGRGAYYTSLILTGRGVRMQYLKRWWSSLSWRCSVRAAREFRGAVSLAIQTVWAHMRSRTPLF